MIGLNRRRVFFLILASMLVSVLGAFNPSTFADEGTVLESGGSYSCPAPAGCGNWGCHAKSVSDSTQVCHLYNLAGSTGCTGTRTCDAAP